MSSADRTVKLTVNGKDYESSVEVRKTLADFLRDELAQGDDLNALQLAFQENHALQCGFCTPGMLMTAYAFLQDTPDPTEEQVKEGISGNICRCTGYAPIIQAILQTSKGPALVLPTKDER